MKRGLNFNQLRAIVLFVLLTGCSGSMLFNVKGQIKALLSNSTPTQPFVAIFQTSSPGDAIELPLRAGFNYNMTADWGDGTSIQTITSWNDVHKTHVYSSAGTYTVTLSGICEAWYFNNSGPTAGMITSVIDLGDMGWVNLENAFYGAYSLTSVAGGNVSHVTDMAGMFRDTSSLASADFSTWNTGNVTDMNYMFSGAMSIDPDTSSWNTAKVTDMAGMFYSNSSANPDTTNWNTVNVTTMNNMFSSATLANPNTSNWNTCNVTDMGLMFYFANSANPDTTNWNTNNVTTTALMFGFAPSANPVTTNWNTSNVTLMNSMFRGATSANPITTNWNTANVTDMSNLFAGASFANPNTSNWNTSNVTSMAYTFYDAAAANPDMTNWNFANVTNFTDMLSNSGMTKPNYSSFLIQVESQNAMSNLTLGASNLYYDSSATAAHSSLNTRGWTINDLGLQ